MNDGVINQGPNGHSTFTEYDLNESAYISIGKVMSEFAMPFVRLNVWVNYEGKLKMTNVIVNVFENSVKDLIEFVHITLKNRNLYLLAFATPKHDLKLMKLAYPSLKLDYDDEGRLDLFI